MPVSGYQPRNTPAERRAFFDIERQLRALPAENVIFDPGFPGITETDLQSVFTQFVANSVESMSKRATPTAAAGMDQNVIICVAEAHLLLTRTIVIGDSIRNNTGGAIGVGADLFTVPVGYRPAVTARIIGVNATTGASMSIMVSTAGLAEIEATPATIANGSRIIVSGQWVGATP